MGITSINYEVLNIISGNIPGHLKLSFKLVLYLCAQGISELYAKCVHLHSKWMAIENCSTESQVQRDSLNLHQLICHHLRLIISNANILSLCGAVEFAYTQANGL